jgi:hypothetical protein
MEDWLCLRVPSSDTARGKAEFEKGELGRRGSGSRTKGDATGAASFMGRCPGGERIIATTTTPTLEGKGQRLSTFVRNNRRGRRWRAHQCLHNVAGEFCSK